MPRPSSAPPLRKVSAHSGRAEPSAGCEPPSQGGEQAASSGQLPETRSESFAAAMVCGTHVCLGAEKSWAKRDATPGVPRTMWGRYVCGSAAALGDRFPTAPGQDASRSTSVPGTTPYRPSGGHRHSPLPRRVWTEPERAPACWSSRRGRHTRGAWRPGFPSGRVAVSRRPPGRLAPGRLRRKPYRAVRV